MRVLVLVLCAGCCADTYEIDADRTHQGLAQLTVSGSTWLGELYTRTVAAGYDTTLSVPSSDEYVLHVAALAAGTYATTIDHLRGSTSLATLHVTIATDVILHQVCMSSDQDDYGTGRCGFSFVGTITVTGDATGTWMLDQIAVVAAGTPDC